MSVFNPADHEVFSVIRFLIVKNFHVPDIHRQLVEVYGESVVSEGKMRKLCSCFFEEEPMYLLMNDPESQLQSLRISYVLKVDEHFCQIRRLIIDLPH